MAPFASEVPGMTAAAIGDREPLKRTEVSRTPRRAPWPLKVDSGFPVFGNGFDFPQLQGPHGLAFSPFTEISF